MNPVTRFTIDRRAWLRGEGSHASALLRVSDGKACFFGWYLRACGVPDALMGDVASPTHVPTRTVPPWIRHFSDSACVSHAAQRLMSINDDTTLTDAAREAALTLLAAAHGLAVQFVDGPPVRVTTRRT